MSELIRDFLTTYEYTIAFTDGERHAPPITNREALAALDALVAENQRLREALEKVIDLGLDKDFTERGRLVSAITVATLALERTTT
jgi:hypothetical protein